MDNSKKNVHTSGALGMLMKEGQIKRIDQNLETKSLVSQNTNNSYFRTQSGIEFTENELIYVDPTICEPWKYANRQENELGDIDNLVESIKQQQQLQPVLIRKHPAPHDNIKYEIIFGRRRHLACLKLNKPLLAICKDIPSEQDAIASQDAENKLRNDVSDYSNAVLYKRLIEDGIFKNEKDLSIKLNISSSTLSDLMAYNRLPKELINSIPNIHFLSKSVVLKLCELVKKGSENLPILIALASEIGNKISSPNKLENALLNFNKSELTNRIVNTKVFKGNNGKRIFSTKINHRGEPTISLDKSIMAFLDFEQLCNQLQNIINEHIH